MMVGGVGVDSMNPIVTTLAAILRRVPFDNGRWRLIPFALWACESCCQSATPRCVRTRHGFVMNVDVSEWLGRHIYVTGEYEPSTTDLFLACVRPESVVLDIGANAGYFSLLAASLVGPSGKVIAFEPVASIATSLRKNIAANRFANCEVFELVASNTEGTCEFFVGPANHSGTSSLRTIEGSSRRIEVECVPLDSLLGDVPSIDFVKVDVEGAECHVLEGMVGILERHRPDIVCEITPEFLSAMGRSPKDIASLLARFGYTAYAVEHKRLRRLANIGGEVSPQFNVFFTAKRSLPEGTLRR